MKKSIVYLGIALVAFTNISLASGLDHKLFNIDKCFVLQGYDRGALNVAISRGDIDTVKKFIEYGENVNKISGKMSPLMTAARYNKVEIIKLLIAKGADLDTEAENGYTALKYAEVSKAKEAATFLKSILKS
ncbi:ankyrin repeat domain-containing protein [Flavobacterium sp. LS1R49]|uniref:Ankyrin repeat domain-containing protein n=1 Tax=Flavobacterium shii TaxID=2987687 RepID=A0A9X2ZED5_9FLAO|nr:ankyrin repeat domain-containing protein [Flavobacterium shii]MCV9927810.1 ankyrin repeat domain-containing protein [Flavobacterium shii]